MNTPTFKIHNSKDGQLYFCLCAGNGEVIATSEMYTTREALTTGIEAVQKCAPIAMIEDYSK